MREGEEGGRFGVKESGGDWRGDGGNGKEWSRRSWREGEGLEQREGETLEGKELGGKEV